MAKLKTKIIMKNLAAVAIAGLFSQSSFAAPVFVEWSVGSGGNGHQYALTEIAGDWQQAEAEAVLNGGHLVAVNSQAEQDFLVSTFLTGTSENMPLWLGLTDEASEGVYTWSNGEAFTYNNWKVGEPNNYQEEDYVAMNWDFARGQGVKGTWNDVPLAGTVGYAGQANGPYFGIIEITAAVGSVSVPAPASLGLFGLAFAALGLRRKAK